MADTYTANYNFTQPEVNASRDTWGNKHNQNWGSLDNILKAISDRIADKVSADRVGFLAGNKLRPYMRHTDGTEVRMTTPAEVDAAIIAWVPRGVIVAWSGTTANIPAGWALCNGQNGTPNLARRFIFGAGTGAGVGATGGTEQHNHAGNTGGTALSEAQMPHHGHGLNDPGHNHHVNDPGHRHNYSVTQISQNGRVIQGGAGIFTFDEGRVTDQQPTGVYLSASGTNISVAGAGGGQAHAHGIATDNHLPPYFVLAYIMKL